MADAGIDYCREHGQTLCLSYLLWGKAEALLARGAWDEATDVARSILGDRKSRDPWILGDLALWRWRAGLLTEAPEGIDAVSRAQIEGRHEQAATIRRKQGCFYEAALALADADDEAALRGAHAELQALGARPAAAIVARRLRQRGSERPATGPPATDTGRPRWTHRTRARGSFTSSPTDCATPRSPSGSSSRRRPSTITSHRSFAS